MYSFANAGAWLCGAGAVATGFAGAAANHRPFVAAPIAMLEARSSARQTNAIFFFVGSRPTRRALFFKPTFQFVCLRFGLLWPLFDIAHSPLDTSSGISLFAVICPFTYIDTCAIAFLPSMAKSFNYELKVIPPARRPAFRSWR